MNDILFLSNLAGFFIAMILGFIFYFRMYDYLKKNKPKTLRNLIYKGWTLFTFLPEYMRYDPFMFIRFLFTKEKGKHKELNLYKLGYILSVILFVILIFANNSIDFN
jgi:hypothetical protein